MKLEKQLQTELNLPGACGQGCNASRLEAGTRTRKHRGARRAEIHAIEYIECFGAELKARTFGKRGRLEDGEIDIRQAWTCENPSSDVSICTDGWERERGRVKPLLRVMRNDRACEGC